MTPVRAALRQDSPLQERVEAGLGAVKTSDRDYIDAPLRTDFADSLDIDEGLGKEKRTPTRTVGIISWATREAER